MMSGGGFEADRADEPVEIIDDAVIEAIELGLFVAVHTMIGGYRIEQTCGEGAYTRSNSFRKTRQIEYPSGMS